jgi:hypothetical protein
VEQPRRVFEDEVQDQAEAHALQALLPVVRSMRLLVMDDGVVRLSADDVPAKDD